MENDKIDLRKYINAIKRGWILGAIAFAVVMGLVIYYCSIKAPQYETYSQMLIETESDNGASRMGGMSSLMRSFSFGGFGSSSIDNEILIINSNSLKKQMVNRLGLNRTYYERNGMKKTILYKNSPVMVAASNELFDTLQTSFKIRLELKGGGKVDVKATKGMFSRVLAEKKDVILPCSLETPFGTFQLLKTDNYSQDDNRTIDVLIQGDAIVVSRLSKNLEVGYASKKADGVDLLVLDESKERGRDMLNMLMSLYNERRRDRKSECATADVEFLDQRLALIGTELLQAETDLEQLKAKNSFVDVGTEVPLMIQQNVAIKEEMLKLQVEEMTLQTMLKQLNDPEKRYSLIPMSESLGEQNAAVVIANYNELVMKRNLIMKSAKDGNEALQQLTSQIDVMRESAIDNVKRLQEQLDIKYKEISKEDIKFKNRIGVLPQYQREFLNLARDRELKNALYMFLIEKRESALLKQNYTQESGFVFEPAYSALKANNNKLYIILGIGIAFALVSFVVVSLVWGTQINKKNN